MIDMKAHVRSAVAATLLGTLALLGACSPEPMTTTTTTQTERTIAVPPPMATTTTTTHSTRSNP